MGFLDNSGDIILDAVLTDLGRKRLAEGNFKITQFALGDDEINYTLYNANHASGSAYYDLEIIQTPVLESFTNNTSTMKSRLITLNNNNILYLPVLKENNLTSERARHASNTFLVAVDEKTQVTRAQDTNTSSGIGKATGAEREGVLYGLNPEDGKAGISIHQGIDNLNKPKAIALGSDLKEESYVIQIDGRFGTIVDPDGVPVTGETAGVTEDDDGFLFYTVSLGDQIVRDLGSTAISPLLGSRGSQLAFKIKASSVLTDNESFFDRFGFSTTVHSKACKAIDSTVRVTGLKTGYSIDIPVRFIKDVS